MRHIRPIGLTIPHKMSIPLLEMEDSQLDVTLMRHLHLPRPLFATDLKILENAGLCDGFKRTMSREPIHRLFAGVAW